MTANVSMVNLQDGRIVCLSYGVPVAAFVPGRGTVKTSERFSVTSSRHANTFARQNGGTVAEVEPAEFAQLIAPIVSGR